MTTIVRLEVPVRRPGTSTRLGVMVGFAAVAAAYGLIMWVQIDSDMPEAFTTSIPISLALAVGLFVAAFVVHRRTLETVFIDCQSDGTTTLRIRDLEVTGTVKIIYGYCPGEVVHTGTSVFQMTMLWCDFWHGDVLALRLMHQLGSIYSPLGDWEPLQPPPGRNSEFGHLNCGTVVNVVEKLTRSVAGRHDG